jgi:hypothetical protein
MDYEDLVPSLLRVFAALADVLSGESIAEFAQLREFLQGAHADAGNESNERSLLEPRGGVRATICMVKDYCHFFPIW